MADNSSGRPVQIITGVILLTDRISHWLTLAANLGVIVGIVFLVLEIRQNSDIATAQVRLDYASGWRSVDEKRQDQAFALVYSKSILVPDELSLGEIIQLDAYYAGVIDQMLSALAASKAGLRDGQIQNVALQAAIGYFSNAYAQAWWQENRQLWSYPGGIEFQNIMDEAIAAASKSGNRDYFEGIQRRLTSVSGSTAN